MTPGDMERALFDQGRDIKDLQRALRDEKDKVTALEKQVAATSKKMNTAETWGRAVIWTGIAAGGMATQIGSIIELFKK